MALEIAGWDEAPPERAGAALTLGVFDGVHLGHQALIEKIVSRGPCPTVVTFRENPKKIFSPETYPGDILSFAQKLDIFESLGVKRAVVIDFSQDFSRMKGRDFIELLDERWKPAFMALGGNFRCGCGRDTGAALIQRINRERGIPTEVVPPVRYGGAPVSSTRIREAILAGDMALAEALLGRPCARGVGGKGIFALAVRRGAGK